MKAMRILARVIGAAAGAAGLFVFLAPFFKYGVMCIGNMAGIALSVWTLLLCVTPFGKWMKRHLLTRWLFRLANVVYALVLVYGAVVTGAMLFTAGQAPAKNATAVVLGAQVKGSGPSLILKRRIEAAERYLHDNPEAKAVLSGGKGTDEQISEADCMYNVMVADGIVPERLLKEDKSTCTDENLRFSAVIIKEQALNPSVALVTDGFHLLRARLIADKQGVFESVGSVSAETDWVFVPTYAVREWFALPAMYFNWK